MPPTRTFETVGVLSDTHLSQATPEFMNLCEQHFGACQRLLHAGDITSMDVLRALEARWEVDAVRGNMDFVPELSHLPRIRRVQVGGLDVLLCHGHGAPGGIEELVLGDRASEPPGIVVSGHTHQPGERQVAGIHFLNPGSPTDQRYAPYRSLGRLTVEGHQIRFEIIPLD